MKLAIRAILAFITFLSTYFFIYWIPLALIRGALEKPIIINIISAVVGIGVAYLVWKKTGKMNDTLFQYVFVSGIVAGGVLFLGGFIGPMLFTPNNNFGPLLGFFLGPIGFVLGLLGGGLYWWFKIKNRDISIKSSQPSKGL